MSRFPYLFIITHGRSGSTILQKQLNSIDGYEIKGENCNTLFKYFQMYRQLMKAESDHQKWKQSRDQPWWGMGDWQIEELDKRNVNQFKKFILNENTEAKVNGFKEIRYFDHIPHLRPFLHYLIKHFPGCGFLFNFRNHDDVVNSAWWANAKEVELREKLKYFTAECEFFMKNNPSISHKVVYEELGSEGTVSALEKFLGDEIDRTVWQENLSRRLEH